MRRSQRSTSLATSIEKTFLIRFALSYLLFLTVFFGMQATWFGQLLGHSLTVPIGFNSFALFAIPLFAPLFLTIHQQDLKKWKSIPWPQGMYRVVGIFLFILSVACASWYTHPSLERFQRLDAFMSAYAPMGELVVATTLYASLFLPLLPAFTLTLPAVFLRRYAKDCCAATFLIVLYFVAQPLEAIFHIATGPFVLRSVAILLGALPGTTVAAPERWEISYNGFAAVVGPLCSGFSAFVLFMGFFVILWVYQAQKAKIRHTWALGALLSGLILLFLLNIIRITLIMIIGSFVPAFGLFFFHGVVGSFIFLFLVFLYIRWIFPLLVSRRGS